MGRDNGVIDAAARPGRYSASAMKKLLSLGFGLLACLSTARAAREQFSFDPGWQFLRGDAPGAEKPEFDSAGWRTVDAPHDYSIEKAKDSIFDPNSPARGDGGFITSGVGWYRKTFKLPESAKGRRVFIEFDGVYMDSEVWLNGQLLGHQPYGYTSFHYELTPALKAENVIAVRCNVVQPCSRWFSGAGIYRHVRLLIVDPVHVALQGGLYVTTPEITKDSATIRVRTAVTNQNTTASQVKVRTIIKDPGGREVARAESNAGEVPAGGEQTVDQAVKAPAPALWSLKTPRLYSAESEVLVAGKSVDACKTPFGIRTIEFTKDRGFFLNGERVPIQGVCDHHDQGSLGAAAYDRAIERQLEILKSFGCNAIRTSHNPPAPALLDACDRLGFLVMDEAFDEWKEPKTEMGYSRFFDEWSERDIVSMLRRDRNHPSVILWSIGNEIPEQRAANAAEMSKRLADFCRREDPTRPVTSACEDAASAIQTGYADALDVLGINYHVENYEKFKGAHALIGSETASAVSSRGEYNLVEKDGKVRPTPELNTQMSSYDAWRPPWATSVELSLKKLAESPWVAGEFVWTGFDYIGEPTPFPWPAKSSYFGIVDLCGFPKDRFYLYQSRWTTEPMVHLLPHWNWSQFAGKEIPVWAYSNADTVELFLNGKSLGEKKVADGSVRQAQVGTDRDGHAVLEDYGWYHLEWLAPYAPGELKAVARRGGKIVATDIVRTAGKPAKLALSVDRARIRAGAQDLAYLTVKVLDDKNNVCPDADNLVKYEAAGAGAVAGVDNGDETSHEEFQATERKAFHGLGLAVVRSAKTAGPLKVKATSAGLAAAEVEINVESLPTGQLPALD